MQPAATPKKLNLFYRWAGLALFALAWAVYANSLWGVFIFDDVRGIVRNENLHSLQSLGAYFLGARRGLTELTFTLNYAFAGYEPWHWHAVNVTLHGLSAAALYYLLRALGRLETAPRVFRQHAQPLALAIAAIWLVHPLASQPVNYIIQRSELLMALFYLLTLLSMVRHVESQGRERKLWAAGAVLACHLGMISKEPMFTAPLVALLLDWALLSRSAKELVKQRWWLYALLFAAWGHLLAGGMLASLTPSPESAGKASAGVNMPLMSPTQYLLNQGVVIWRYLWLSIWPAHLAFDWYLEPRPMSDRLAWTASVGIGLLFLASLCSLAKRSLLGLLGVAFFLVLAPSSSFVPILDVMVEHRMYLPLAMLVALVVIAMAMLADWLTTRWPRLQTAMPYAAALTSLAVVLALSYRTIDRNLDYRSEYALWATSAAASPGAYRARYHLVQIHAKRGEFDQAVARAIDNFRRVPRSAFPSSHLGVMYARAGDAERGEYFLRRALRMDPTLGVAYLNLGISLDQWDRPEQAKAALRKAIEYRPQSTLARTNLAIILLREGDADGALATLREAEQISPLVAEQHVLMAEAYKARGELDRALAHFLAAIEQAPENADYHNSAGAVLGQMGRFVDAINHFEQAIKLAPEWETPQRNLAKAKAVLGR